VGDVGVELATKHSVEELIGGYNPVTVVNNLERAKTQLRAR
jgi:rRNA processing protein Krr1/Pno1